MCIITHGLNIPGDKNLVLFRSQNDAVLKAVNDKNYII